MYAFGLTMDSLMNASRFMLLSSLAEAAGAVSRFGPIVPVEFAGAKVWHVAQPCEAKTAFPAAAFPPPEEVVVAADVVVPPDVVVAAEVEPTVTVCTTVADGFPPSEE
jgi:hypothetical protein